MSCRAPPREYYEEEEFEVERERDRYPRSRRRERDLDGDVEYRRRRSMPPVEDLERMRIRERPPRDFVQESYAPPRDRGPLVRRARDELDEPLPEPEREDVRMRPARRRGSLRAREIEEESELFIGERERHGSRRHRRPRELEEDDMVVRHKERASEGDLRPMERVYEDEREEVYFRPSSGPRRKPSRREAEFEERIIDDREHERPRGSRHRGELKLEEDLVMQWKDRPSPRAQEDDEEIRLRETRRRQRRSPPEPRYVRELPPREPPGSWPADREDDEEEIRIRSRMRSRSRRRGVEDEEEDLVIRREVRDRDSGRESAESDEVLLRKSKRRPPPREPSSSPEPIRAPPIHQDVITHHRHIDHGFDLARPPRAPSPEISSTRTSFDELDVRHRSKKGNRGSRKSEEDIIFKTRDEEESVSPTSGPSLDFNNPWKPDPAPSRRSHKPRSLDDESELLIASHTRSRRDLPRGLDLEEEETEEEIEIHKRRSKPRSIVEGISRETTDEWSVVHTPSKDDAIEMSGGLNVVEVAPKGALEEELDIRGRVEQQIVKERQDERWTEITKDLVVRDAIERLGYEFEETRTFYYIFSYLEPGDIDELVELSDEIRHARRRRIKEMNRERAIRPRRPSLPMDRMPPVQEWLVIGT
ncbi:uncharacterized protein N7482_002804 [Penicillium canariense]|uniref:DUF8035 domain-containing protein n=1 Tax=Penicillium canariense TaxID=189055 RepID=A0A9W9LVG6_9EURO|nr:uncharacterized protein N7482_002804 [Penicillium canariense]KAJ5176927.1 hypothetical protein N7482_002804 [Penicillium canariense]